MIKNLLIVESPSKAKTIKKFLGKDYQVLASVGHIKDLPEKEFGIDIARDFKPKYVTIQGKAKVIQHLRSAAKEASQVLLAPDPDREGEAIAWHIANAIDVPREKIQRVMFNEITKSGIYYGLSRPRQIDMSLVNAQQARRILDRIVGYQVSPFLWKTLYSGLSAGRVQSVALRIICEREEEVVNFVPTEYWEIEADFLTEQQEHFTAKCVKISGKSPNIPDEKTANEHLDQIRQVAFNVKSVTQKKVEKSPSPPFTTSTLQQEATRRFRFGSSKTMKIAQQLYEGVEIDGEPVGLITYMRTDSVRISKEAVTGVREFIANKYGESYLPKNPRFFKTKKKNVQDAHEGIRPTHFNLMPEKIMQSLTPDQKKIYTLIWNRFAACQMASAVYNQKIIDVEGDKYLFRAIENDLVFDGYLRAWREEKAEEEKKNLLPEKIGEGDELKLIDLRPEQKFTEPPHRFTEGTLIKELDNLGIGRPSTYASIVSTILFRKYVEQKVGLLYPTDLGKTVNKILVTGMPDIFNVKFTFEMEENLDKVESNSKDWLDVMRDFYEPFRKSLEKLDQNRKDIKTNLQEESSEKCEFCGSPMVIKWSKNGKFLACSAFPKCKNAKPLSHEPEPVTEEKQCPKCGSQMRLREGKFGKFWACTKYPKCKSTLSFSLNITCPEPDCDGEIVQKRTKKGKTFYGCNRYPDCKFATWNEPVKKACPECGYTLLEKKEVKDKGTVIFCSKCKTEYEDV